MDLFAEIERLIRGNEVTSKSLTVLMILASFAMGGCASQPQSAKSEIFAAQETMAVPKSYLQDKMISELPSDEAPKADNAGVDSSGVDRSGRSKDLAPWSYREC